MKLFKNMTLQEAIQFYNKIKNSTLEIGFKNILLNDIYFFTNEFTTDY